MMEAIGQQMLGFEGNRSTRLPVFEAYRCSKSLNLPLYHSTIFPVLSFLHSFVTVSSLPNCIVMLASLITPTS